MQTHGGGGYGGGPGWAGMWLWLGGQASRGGTEVPGGHWEALASMHAHVMLIGMMGMHVLTCVV